MSTERNVVKFPERAGEVAELWVVPVVTVVCFERCEDESAVCPCM